MGRDIILATDVPADADAVFRTITTQEGQASFWTSDCDVSATEATFRFPGAEGDVHVTVDAAEHGKLVRWTCTGSFPGWEDTTIEWELAAPQGDEGTGVVLRHLGLHGPFEQSDQALGNVGHVWAMILDRLQAFHRDGEPVPFFG